MKRASKQLTLARAILDTLEYADRYLTPLNEQTLHQRLINYQVSLSILRRKLRAMVESGELEYSSGYYFLSGRKSIIRKFMEASEIASSKLAQLKKLLPLLTWHPHIMAIFVTGSLAYDNAKLEDDYDLLIITKSGRLWSTRLVVLFLLTLLGHKRGRLQPRAINKFCCNLWLTTRALHVPKSKHSTYSAYELISAKPVYDPYDYREELILHNRWIKKYLPNLDATHNKRQPKKVKVSTNSISLLERLAYLTSRLYMARAKTSEYVTIESAYFHPQKHD